MPEQILRMVCPIHRQQIFGERFSGRAFFRLAVPVRSGGVSVLIHQHLTRPPSFREMIAEDSSVMAPVSIQVASALPWTDCGQVWRLQCSGLPLLDRIVRNADEAYFSARPRLDAGPFDRIM